MRILIIGGGGREHALTWKLAQSPRATKLFCAPGNAGIAQTAECRALPLQPPFEDLKTFCAREKIDLVVVGPEAPLAAGVTDALTAAGIACFGPEREAARLEASKSFAREVMREAGVPQHEWHVFDSAGEAVKFYRARREPWWIKADGLAAGKGSVLPSSIEEGCALLTDWLDRGAMGEAGRRVVVEQPLHGPEVSLIALADGETLRMLAPSRDYKRLLDGDRGPNTGGMGAWAPSPLLAGPQIRDIEQTMLKPTLAGLTRRGAHFRGFLYAGLILSERGPRVLEFNVRLGDPEAQVILPLLKNDLVDAIEAAMEGRLSSVEVRRREGAAVVAVAAAEGYPASPRKGDRIEGLEEAEALLGANGMIFHAATRRENGEWLTDGGRVLGAMGLGPDLPQARSRAYAALKKIRWPGLHSRRDIAL